MVEAEDGKIPGPSDEGRKRPWRRSAGEVDKVLNPEEGGDS